MDNLSPGSELNGQHAEINEYGLQDGANPSENCNNMSSALSGIVKYDVESSRILSQPGPIFSTTLSKSLGLAPYHTQSQQAVNLDRDLINLPGTSQSHMGQYLLPMSIAYNSQSLSSLMNPSGEPKSSSSATFLLHGSLSLNSDLDYLPQGLNGFSSTNGQPGNNCSELPSPNTQMTRNLPAPIMSTGVTVSANQSAYRNYSEAHCQSLQGHRESGASQSLDRLTETTSTNRYATSSSLQYPGSNTNRTFHHSFSAGSSMEPNLSISLDSILRASHSLNSQNHHQQLLQLQLNQEIKNLPDLSSRATSIGNPSSRTMSIGNSSSRMMSIGNSSSRVIGIGRNDILLQAPVHLQQGNRTHVNDDQFAGQFENDSHEVDNSAIEVDSNIGGVSQMRGESQFEGDIQQPTNAHIEDDPDGNSQYDGKSLGEFPEISEVIDHACAMEDSDMEDENISTTDHSRRHNCALDSNLDEPQPGPSNRDIFYHKATGKNIHIPSGREAQAISDSNCQYVAQQNFSRSSLNFSRSFVGSPSPPDSTTHINVNDVVNSACRPPNNYPTNRRSISRFIQEDNDGVSSTSNDHQLEMIMNPHLRHALNQVQLLNGIDRTIFSIDQLAYRGGLPRGDMTFDDFEIPSSNGILPPGEYEPISDDEDSSNEVVTSNGKVTIHRIFPMQKIEPLPNDSLVSSCENIDDDDDDDDDVEAGPSSFDNVDSMSNHLAHVADQQGLFVVDMPDVDSSGIPEHSNQPMDDSRVSPAPHSDLEIYKNGDVDSSLNKHIPEGDNRVELSLEHEQDNLFYQDGSGAVSNRRNDGMSHADFVTSNDSIVENEYLDGDKHNSKIFQANSVRPEEVQIIDNEIQKPCTSHQDLTRGESYTEGRSKCLSTQEELHNMKPFGNDEDQFQSINAQQCHELFNQSQQMQQLEHQCLEVSVNSSCSVPGTRQVLDNHANIILENMRAQLDTVSHDNGHPDAIQPEPIGYPVELLTTQAAVMGDISNKECDQPENAIEVNPSGLTNASSFVKVQMVDAEPCKQNKKGGKVKQAIKPQLNKVVTNQNLLNTVSQSPAVQIIVDNTHCTYVDGHKRWKCQMCPKVYTSKHNLVSHILGHKGLKPYPCTVCGKNFKQAGHLYQHVLTHGNIKPHSCPHCDRSFTQGSHLKRHLALHMDKRPHVCTVCQSSFIYPSELATHMEKHVVGVRFTCDKCELRFETIKHLKQHMAAEHGNTRDLKCKECGKVFPYQSQLRDHMIKHTGIRPYQCNECGTEFLKEHHLKAHQFTHTGLRPYTCHVCNRCFNMKANLQRHMLIHGNNNKFHCEICKRTFSQPQILKAHMVTHAEEKPYECKECGKKFTRAHNLSGHMHMHSGSKPHTCLCGASFTLKGNLNRHKKEKHCVTTTTHSAEEEAAMILNEMSTKKVYDSNVHRIETENTDAYLHVINKRRKTHPPRKSLSQSCDEGVRDDWCEVTGDCEATNQNEDSSSSSNENEMNYANPNNNKHSLVTLGTVATNAIPNMIVNRSMQPARAVSSRTTLSHSNKKKRISALALMLDEVDIDMSTTTAEKTENKLRNK